MIVEFLVVVDSHLTLSTMSWDQLLGLMVYHMSLVQYQTHQVELYASSHELLSDKLKLQYTYLKDLQEQELSCVSNLTLMGTDQPRPNYTSIPNSLFMLIRLFLIISWYNNSFTMSYRITSECFITK